MYLVVIKLFFVVPHNVNHSESPQPETTFAGSLMILIIIAIDKPLYFADIFLVTNRPTGRSDI